MPTSSHDPLRVLIAGGGIAGVEAALALREFAGAAADVTVVDPGSRFRVPATATGRAFGLGRGIDLRLADVVHRAGATLLRGRLESVEPAVRRVTLAGDRTLAYDALIVAVGAVPVPAVPGALTFTGPADAAAVRGLVDEVGDRALGGAAVALALVVPPGCGWPLAAYELALMTREHLEQLEPPAHAGICIVTSEATPLGNFGPAAADAVGRTLERAGITLRTGAVVRAWTAGRLELADGASLWADRAIALPVHRGPSVRGLPSDDDGFIPTERDGSVPGAPGVWAVGDGAASPVKQGGVACQQADAVAAQIAGGLGMGVAAPLGAPSLRGWMWDGRRGGRLRSGAPAGPGAAETAPVWPVAKVGGRFLAPFLHSLVAAEALSGEPIGVPA